MTNEELTKTVEQHAMFAAEQSGRVQHPVGSKPKYKNDYIAALFAHSFSWSFMIMLPVMLWGQWEWLVLIANMVTHAVIDNAKANKFQINLIQDQICHLIQIIVTWLIFVVI